MCGLVVLSIYICYNLDNFIVHVAVCSQFLKIFSFQIFKNLQYSNKNLSKGSCESLCVLDLEAYLIATVYQSKFLIERKNSIPNTKNESVLMYPPDIADALCSKVQASWWKAAHGLCTCAIKYVSFNFFYLYITNLLYNC